MLQSYLLCFKKAVKTFLRQVKKHFKNLFPVFIA